ncbi:collagen alpha-6(VI) chain-like [Eleginops maclovinus]|uniref:collagen alpha-6(VI) chain-like n=1 Tax=Eleginops maclovinus TaxID=56733 RepID=UPI003080217C
MDQLLLLLLLLWSSGLQAAGENTSTVCENATLADIVFLVDGSSSIERTNFVKIKGFLSSVIKALEIGRNKVRIGLAQYSEETYQEFLLKDHMDKTSLLEAVKRIPKRKGGTETGKAIDFLRTQYFTEEAGSRAGQRVPQIAVVITDGDSTDDVTAPAQRLRQHGVIVFGIGVGPANLQELQSIANRPPERFLSSISNYAALQTLKDSLLKTVCISVEDQKQALAERFADIFFPLDSGVTAAEFQRCTIKEGCVQKDEADIFFLIDHSGSIYPNDFKDMKKFMIEFLNTFRIGPQHVRIGVVKYTDSPDLEFDLTTHSDVKSLEDAVEAIRQTGGGTETGKALTSMVPLFDRALATRGHEVPEYLVVITDGKSADEVKIPAEQVRAQGVTVYAIGVKSADSVQLQEIAGDPKRTFFVNNFDALTLIKDDIITDICSPEACSDRPGDLLFLIDSSGSIGPQDYEKMKEFMKSVITKSAVGQDNVHVGVMQFSTIQQLAFPLNQYFSKDQMLNAITAMQQVGGGTLTGEAITDVSQYFDGLRGGRPGMRQTLIVITDGEAQDEVKEPALAVRNKGVVVYAIGVVDANTTQLLEISGSATRTYTERDFDALKDLENELALKLCNTDTDCKKTEKADIIFLVDGSTSITLEKFRSMQKFMSSMVNENTVGKDLTRFGVILYSTNPKSVFTLKQYSSKREVLRAIQDLKSPYGDTYTGKALAYSLPFFNKDNGGRADLKVPQILMVVTDGDATDRHSLVAPSVDLREHGISVFSIGVEGANKTQLEIMAGHESSRVFYVDNFKALESLYKNITQALCDTPPVCEKQQADLVFLLDHSGSIHPEDYTIMKNFTTDLVNSFKVSENLVRVGLAQFSSEFQDGFYLNQFYSQEVVNKHILSMSHKGGDTEIGRALDSIMGYFEASRGSRRSAGISQNLVLITPGESQDDVEDAADRLRALGIEMFAIGIGDVHELVLLQITGTLERLFTVNNFNSLDKIKQRVVETICKSKDSGGLPQNLLFQPNISVSSSMDGVSGAQQQGFQVFRGSTFTISCSIQPQYPGGSFQLNFTSSQLNFTSSDPANIPDSLPAVNHSAHFLFPAAEPAHQGSYSCVYHVSVSAHGFSSESRLLSVTVTDPAPFILRAVVLPLTLLLGTVGLFFYCKATRGRKPGRQEDMELDDYNLGVPAAGEEGAQGAE